MMPNHWNTPQYTVSSQESLAKPKFEGEKIMSLRKTSEPWFTYTNFPCYVSQTYFVIKPVNINVKVLIAILNSNVIHFWLRNKGKKQGNLLQVDKAQLLALPIKFPNASDDPEINTLIIKSIDLIVESTKKLNEAESEPQRTLLTQRIKTESRKLN